MVGGREITPGVVGIKNEFNTCVAIYRYNIAEYIFLIPIGVPYTRGIGRSTIAHTYNSALGILEVDYCIIAAILGSKHYIIHPIMPFGTNDVSHEKEAYEMNLEFMNRLCNVGRENGIIVCFENMPFANLSLASVQATLDFVKTINSDYFKMCLDTGHCTMFHTAPGDAARLIGTEYLYAVHIHDNDGIKDRHQMPFSGVIDWADFGKSLQEIGFDGVISLETGVPGSIPDALREYEEIGLAKKIRYIANLAEGKLL